MSTEIQKSPGRTYRLKERARKQRETRERITKAIVELHERVGPARTTISDVAELAGVGRMTVYKHFPTESDLFQACSAHWSRENPLPDFGPSLDEEDTRERTESALNQLYAFYGDKHGMLGHIMRDAPLLPALQEIVDGSWNEALDQLRRELTPAGLKGGRRRRTVAALRLVLDLNTWETLTRAGLSRRRAAAMGADIVMAALR